MKAFYFRFLNDDGKATGWVGLVVGQTMDQIFDCIDEYGNPYTVQIQAAKKGGFCVHWKLFPESMRTEQLDRVVEFESDEADNILIDEAYGIALISKV